MVCASRISCCFVIRKVRIMVVVLELLTLLAIFGIIIIDYKVINDLEREKRENTFITQQKIKQTTDSESPIPLAFSRQDEESLLRLCKHYRTVRRSRRRHSDPPTIEPHNIGFRKATYNSIRAYVIRCSEEYVLIDAGDDRCAYVLKKGRSKKGVDSPIFYVYARFCYQHKISEKINSPTDGELTTIETESNRKTEGSLRRRIQNLMRRKASSA